VLESASSESRISVRSLAALTGVTAKSMFLDRGTFWYSSLIYVYLPNNASKCLPPIYQTSYLQRLEVPVDLGELLVRLMYQQKDEAPAAPRRATPAGRLGAASPAHSPGCQAGSGRTLLSLSTEGSHVPYMLPDVATVVCHVGAP